ncbi:MAG: murein biosynthesis integral membrane protein MurJ [Actinomycetales bacterium]|nr:murein biosynthesis integral membrane protein MurJ [Actinomycetales bacterium]
MSETLDAPAARSSALMGLGTLTSRITGVLRTAAVIAAIGFGPFADTYSVANTLPNVLYLLLVGGAINAVFVPQLVRALSNADGGRAYTDRLLTVVGLLLIAITLLGVLLAPWIVGLYAPENWSADDRATAVLFARFLLPQVLFYGAFTMAGQVLNARERFTLPMFAPAANNLVVIVVALLFLAITAGTPTSATVTFSQVALLGAGTTVGIAVQALLLIAVLPRAGYRFRPRFDWRGHGLAKAGGLASWTLGLVLVNQVAALVIIRLAAAANVATTDAGGISVGVTSYQNAYLVLLLPHGIIAVSLITAMLPRMSRAAAGADLPAVAGMTSATVRASLAFMIPSAGILILLAVPIAELLFGRGAATPAEAALTGVLLQILLLALVPLSVFGILQRMYYAIEDTRTPFLFAVLLSCVQLGVGVGLYTLAAPELQVAMLAIGTSTSFTVAAVLMWVAAARRLGGLPTRSVVRIAGRSLLATGVAVALGLGVNLLWPVAPAWLRIIVVGGVCILTYIVAAHLLRIDEIRAGIVLIGRRLRPIARLRRIGGPGR